MMFKDTPDGRTHYYGDGHPEHTKEMDPSDNTNTECPTKECLSHWWEDRDVCPIHKTNGHSGGTGVRDTADKVNPWPGLTASEWGCWLRHGTDDCECGFNKKELERVATMAGMRPPEALSSGNSPESATGHDAQNPLKSSDSEEPLDSDLLRQKMHPIIGPEHNHDGIPCIMLHKEPEIPSSKTELLRIACKHDQGYEKDVVWVGSETCKNCGLLRSTIEGTTADLDTIDTLTRDACTVGFYGPKSSYRNRLEAFESAAFARGRTQGKHEQRHQDLGVSRWISVGEEYDYWSHPMTTRKCRNQLNRTGVKKVE